MKICLQNLNKCICQKVKDNKGDKRLTSTEKGRQGIISTSTEILNGHLFSDVKSKELCLLKYHVNTCYSRYIRQGGRAESRMHKKVKKVETFNLEEQETPDRKRKEEVSQQSNVQILFQRNHVSYAIK